MEAFELAFEKNVWAWDDLYMHFEFLLTNVDVDYTKMNLSYLYEFAKNFAHAYMNASAGLTTVEGNEETAKAMKEYVTYYNKVVDHLISIEGESAVVKQYIVKIET